MEMQFIKYISEVGKDRYYLVKFKNKYHYLILPIIETAFIMSTADKKIMNIKLQDNTKYKEFDTDIFEHNLSYYRLDWKYYRIRGKYADNYTKVIHPISWQILLKELTKAQVCKEFI